MSLDTFFQFFRLLHNNAFLFRTLNKVNSKIQEFEMERTEKFVSFFSPAGFGKTGKYFILLVKYFNSFRVCRTSIENKKNNHRQSKNKAIISGP